MKYHSLNLIELSEQELLEIDPYIQVLVYNIYSCMYHLDFAKDICKRFKNVEKRDLDKNSRRYFLFNIGGLTQK